MITEILNKIQVGLKAPKNQKNSFGNYNYRNCEDILNALKPYLSEHQCVVLLNDEIVQIGDRFYVKATATLTDGEEEISNTAYAREEQTKKGMDSSQITGATSSYARKYALNGLFAIDDVKDADATNKHNDEDIDDMVSQVKEALTKGDWATLELISRHESYNDVWGKLDNQKKGKIKELVKQCDAYRSQLNELAAKDDASGVTEILNELAEDGKTAKKVVWDSLNENTQHYINSLKQEKAA